MNLDGKNPEFFKKPARAEWWLSDYLDNYPSALGGKIQKKLPVADLRREKEKEMRSLIDMRVYQCSNHTGQWEMVYPSPGKGIVLAIQADYSLACVARMTEIAKDELISILGEARDYQFLVPKARKKEFSLAVEAKVEKISKKLSSLKKRGRSLLPEASPENLYNYFFG